MVLLILIGASVYVVETGCAGQGKLNLWENCAEEIHNDCFETEDPLDCGYEYYRACVDRSQ